MINNFLFFLFLLLLASCKHKKSEGIKITSEVPANFEMYKTSEMAGLMRSMLQKNEHLRTQIIEGDSIGEFDKAYLKIHTATLTNNNDFDETYPTFASHFIEMQKGVFQVEKPKQKKQFNSMIDACIACHKDRCTGPIPRIEKLRIK